MKSKEEKRRSEVGLVFRVEFCAGKPFLSDISSESFAKVYQKPLRQKMLSDQDCYYRTCACLSFDPAESTENCTFPFASGLRYAPALLSIPSRWRLISAT